MQLKISNTDGTTIFSNDVIKVTVSSGGKITEVIYGATTVAAIPAWNGTNAKYEIGIVGERGGIVTFLSN